MLTIDDGVFVVKATSGDTHLGGEDFDSRMVTHFNCEFKRKDKKVISGNEGAVRLHTGSDNAKRNILTRGNASTDADLLFDSADFHALVSPEKFVCLCKDNLNQSTMSVERVFQDGKVDKKPIREVVLGFLLTRTPKAVRLLNNLFNGNAPTKSINPDEAIAYGAAVQANILTCGSDKNSHNILLLDVAQHNHGFETAGRCHVRTDSPEPDCSDQVTELLDVRGQPC